MCSLFCIASFSCGSLSSLNVVHAPAVCTGPVEQQLAGMKLQPGAAHSRRQSADRISASVSPEPEATAAPEHHADAALVRASSSSSSSHDAMPPLTDRTHGLQKTLHTVRMKLAELVRLPRFNQPQWTAAQTPAKPGASKHCSIQNESSTLSGPWQLI